MAQNFLENKVPCMILKLLFVAVISAHFAACKMDNLIFCNKVNNIKTILAIFIIFNIIFSDSQME